MKHASLKGQTVLELALFGAVLIFVLGVVIQQTLNYNYIQSHNLKSLRMAMTQSFEYSEGLRGGGGSDGDRSRTTASVIFIEDRLTAASAKYGSIDRAPNVASGSATYSRNIFLPIDPVEEFNLPVADFFINGQHFPFSTSGFHILTLDPTDPDYKGIWKKVFRHDNSLDWCVSGDCQMRFDLNRDETLDAVEMEAWNNRDIFAWQWMEIDPDTIDVDTGKNTSVDVDGDLKEENLLRFEPIPFVNPDTGLEEFRYSVIAIDGQEGDFDFTTTEAEILAGAPEPGLTNEMKMRTILNDGTTLIIDEGQLFGGGEFVRNATRKDQIDIIERVIQLSNDTGRFCSGGTPNPTVLYGPINRKPSEIPNPVEVCGSLATCIANDRLTCMVVGGDPKIFVRSRVLDGRGRKWITDKSSDNYVRFATFD